MAHFIYADELTSLKHGYPLWDPDCSPEVSIADVGYVRDGQFCRLFNASLPKGHEANRSVGEPDGYEPLFVGDIRDRTPHPPGIMASRSVSKRGVDTGFSGSILQAGASFNFECNKKRGAILVINSDAYRKDALRLGAFKEYLLKHHESWLKLANNARNARDISSSDLVFVTGCDNTADWATAAFRERSLSGGISFQAGYPSVADANFSIWGSWEQSSTMQSHCGPRIPRPARSTADSGSLEIMPTGVCAADLHIYNQCIFLRGFRIMTRKERARRKVSLMVSADSGGIEGVPRPWYLRSTSGSELSSSTGSLNRESSSSSLGGNSMQLSKSTLDSEVSDIEVLSNYPQGRAPVEVLLEFILETSISAEIAVAHDDDLAEIIKDGEEDTDWDTMVRTAAISVRVDANGVATIKKREKPPVSELPVTPVKDEVSLTGMPLQLSPEISGSFSPDPSPAHTPRARPLELFEDKLRMIHSTASPEPVAQRRTAQSGPSSTRKHKVPGGPDVMAYHAEQERIRAEIDTLQARLATVQDKISLTTTTGRLTDRRNALRAELDALRDEKVAQRTAYSATTSELKTIQEETRKKVKDLQSLTKKLPARTTDEVDTQIRTLERRVETGTMSLPAEKAALRQISSLRRSRTAVGASQALQADIDANRAQADKLRNQLYAESDDGARTDAVREELKRLDMESNAAFSGRGALFNERAQLQIQLSTLHGQRRQIAEGFRAEREEYRRKEGEERAKAAEKARLERAVQEEQRRVQAQERLLERARAPAFATEIRDCQTLLEYFSGTSKVDCSVSSVSPISEEMHLPRQPVENHPDAWTGWVPLNKAEEDSYFAVGKGKAKKSRRKGTTSTSAGSTKVSVPLGILSTLLSLSITPPSVAADIPRTMEELRSKMEWFEANQTRVTEENVARTKAELQLVAKPNVVFVT